VTDDATRHNQAAYDRIAGLYAQRQAGLSRSFADLTAAFTDRLPPAADVADLGCGPAVDGAVLARAGHRVVGLDRSRGMLAHAARALPGRVVQADLRSLPVADGRLDGIWCCASLLHLPQDETMTVLREMCRVLRQGGHLALITALGQGARLEPVPYAQHTKRWFFYRDPAELDDQLRRAGFQVLARTEESTTRQWVKVLARTYPAARCGRRDEVRDAKTTVELR
jgi:SAM-dependent methyltransferase